MSAGPLPIGCMIADHLSIVFHQNIIPIISDFSIENQGDSDLADIEIALVRDPQAWLADVLARISDHAATGSMSCCPGMGPARKRPLSRRLDLASVAQQGALNLTVIVAQMPEVDEEFLRDCFSICSRRMAFSAFTTSIRQPNAANQLSYSPRTVLKTFDT